MNQPLLKILCKVICRAFLPKLKFYGEDKLTDKSGSIVFIKDESFVDPVIVSAVIDSPLVFCADREWFEKSFLRKHYLMIDSLIIEDETFEDSLKERIARKENVVVFIGSLMHENCPGERFKKIISLIRETNCTYYPGLIKGSGTAFPENGLIPNVCPVSFILSVPFRCFENSFSAETILKDIDLLAKNLKRISSHELPSIFFF